MCGIVGCVGKIWKAEEEAFKLLLQLDTIRGPHSTGVVRVGPKSEWEYLKKTGTPWELFEAKDWGTMMRKTHRALIGHNRWATVGAVKDENAHPFHHGNFIGVHNGTIRSKWKMKDHANFEVDSSNIYFNMSEEGIEETIVKLDGAFALVWYNQETNAIQMVRNKERPLWICKTEEGKTYFWASEAWMLRIALAKNNIKHSDPIELKEGELVSFSVPEDSFNIKDFLPRIKAVELYKAPVQESNFYYGSNGRFATRGAQSTYHSGGTKVIPFVKAGVGGHALKDYIGKTVVFSVIGERSKNNNDFILCEVEDSTGPDLRVFVGGKTKLGKLLLSSNKLFTAKVKGCTSNEKYGNYLTVDHRSLRELENTEQHLQEQLLLSHQRDESADGVLDEEDKKIVLPGYRGKLLTLEQWYKETEAGCSWCSDYPRITQANDLEWYSPKQYLCPECATDPSIVQYL